MLVVRIEKGAPGEWSPKTVYPVMGMEHSGGSWHFLVPDDTGEYHDLSRKHVRDMTSSFAIVAKAELQALQKAAASKLFKPGSTPK